MKSVLSLLVIVTSLSVWAQSSDKNETSAKSTDVVPAGAAKTNDIDAEITNAKLRASSVGSKNALSLKLDLNLNGGNLVVPFGEVRPNYAGIAGQDSSTSLSGTIAGAYRLNDRSSLRAGTGVSISTPFQANSGDLGNSNGKRTTSVSNPYLDFSYAARLGNAQNIFDTSYTQYTQPVYTDKYKMVGSYDVNHTIAWEFSSTKWSPGINIDANYTFFSDSTKLSDTMSNPEDGRSDWTIAVFPYAEYAFNDKYSFRTVFRFLTFDHYRADNSSQVYRELYTQSLGLGIAVTRDIYLYPNLQFAPEYMSMERTNIGLSTSINL